MRKFLAVVMAMMPCVGFCANNAYFDNVSTTNIIIINTNGGGSSISFNEQTQIWNKASVDASYSTNWIATNVPASSAITNHAASHAGNGNDPITSLGTNLGVSVVFTGTVASGAFDVQGNTGVYFSVVSYDPKAAYGSTVRGGHAGGVVGAPSATSNAWLLYRMGGFGHNGTAFTGVKAAIDMYSSNDWNTVSNGSYISYRTTPDGSATMVERERTMARGEHWFANMTTPPDVPASGFSLFASNNVAYTIDTAGTIFPMNVETNVGFSAGWNAKTQTLSAGVEATVGYNTVVRDTSGGFTAASGVYTTKVQGVYIFSAHTIPANPGSGSYYMLIQSNGNQIAGSYVTDPAVAGTFASGMQVTVIKEFPSGVEIKVRAYSSAGTTLSNTAQDFSGALLYRTGTGGVK